MTQVHCPKTSGGKGNLNMFIERDPKIQAAGVPSAQANAGVKELLNVYQLQDEVDALICDAIKPSPKSTKLPPLRFEKKRDMRNAGIFSDGSCLLKPPVKSKLQTLVEDFKSTPYSSYWKKVVGKSYDPVPLLPAGFNCYETALGQKRQSSERLYDVVMPRNPVEGDTPVSKNPGYQSRRNYCTFNSNMTFGSKSKADPSGKVMKCCLTIDSIPEGMYLKTVITEQEANFQNATAARLGLPITPNDNIARVPKGFAFGKLSSPDNLAECLRNCEMNPYKDSINKSMGHLNKVRKCLSKRLDGNFFHNFYLRFKYLDKSKTGWLTKQIVYDRCQFNSIRFVPSLVEPLLSIWGAFDGALIHYKKFIDVIDYRLPTPELPKIQDIPESCIHFQTTYGDMTNTTNNLDRKAPMAGLPSGKYFDKDNVTTPEGLCKADRFYLPQESDAKACLSPSILTLLGVSHRDMFAKRDPQTVRNIFERVGEEFTNDSFDIIWNNAKKFHSQEWVCVETFRRALLEFTNTPKS